MNQHLKDIQSICDHLFVLGFLLLGAVEMGKGLLDNATSLFLIALASALICRFRLFSKLGDWTMKRIARAILVREI